jgi:hypothetical protein
MSNHKVTIVLDNQLMKKLRKKQAKMIQNSTKNISLSFIIIETLKESI